MRPHYSVVLLAALAASPGLQLARAQNCPISTLETLPDVVAPCCESMPGGTCRDGFPAICPQVCAAGLVTYWNACDVTIAVFPDDQFPNFLISGVRELIQSCRQVNTLVQRGHAAGCAASVGNVQTRVGMIQDTCCTQNGENACTSGGGPSQCDAACALAFIPYYVQCIEQTTASSGAGVGTSPEDVRVFTTMFSQCTEHLPANETSILLSLVRDRDIEPSCRIDTDSILTLSEAKSGPPPCEADSSTMCDRLISSGTFTCESSFCLLCDQAHNCDFSCSLPCSSGDATGSPAPSPVCERDSSNMCSALIAGGTMTCESDFCASCTQPGTCDHSCRLPCADATGDGHRRALGESMFPSFFQPSPDCSWDDLDDTVRMVDEVCCSGVHGGCGDGLPELCSYECGKIFVPFLNQCGDKLEGLIEDDETMVGFHAFQANCLQLDPKTMVLAIENSVCQECGDGEVSAGEDCDDGSSGNSDAPNAHCRLDCHLARCGDGILDSGNEECDAGARNSDDMASALTCSEPHCPQCLPDCTRPCPELTPVPGMQISYSNNRQYPTNAAYSCATGAAPSGGDVQRECQANGRWAGGPPTVCVNAGFEVLSGPCTTQDGDRCVSRTGYGDNEHCTIAVTSAMTISDCPVFNTEAGYDILSIGGRQFSGTDCPANVEVSPENEITWVSDGSISPEPTGDGVCNGGTVTDLARLQSPLTGDTSGSGDNYEMSCGGSGNEAMFSLSLRPGASIDIGMDDNTYDSRHETSWGGDCPGQNVVTCTDDPDTTRHQWTNDQGSAQTVFFVIDAYSSGSGTFTLSWTATGNSGGEEIHDASMPRGFTICRG